MLFCKTNSIRACLSRPGRVRACAPEPETTQERIAVLAQTRFLGKRAQFIGFSSTKDDGVGLERGNQAIDDVVDVRGPFFLTVTLQAGRSDEILKDLVLAVW